MRVENINTDILRAAAEQADVHVWEKFPKLSEWLQGQKYPTLRQLAEFAKSVHLPFGYFFLQQLPDYEYPIPHYRTIGKDSFTASAELRETISTVEQRQSWAKEILLDLGNEKLPFAKSITTNTPVQKAVETIQEVLQLSGNWAQSVPTWKDAFSMLVRRAEGAGIFVVVNGVVGNNTHRPLDVKEFRGFVLYDDIAPFIFVNGNDALSGKIFTIIHEIVHVLLGESASFDLDHLRSASSNKVEKYCDRVTAEFLVPIADLQAAMWDGVNDYQELARQFKVSQIVIARRMLDEKLISKAEYFNFYEEYIARVSQRGSDGGNFHNTAPYRVSRRFFDLVFQSVKQNKMLYTDAFRLTGLKASTFDKYIEKHY